MNRLFTVSLILVVSSCGSVTTQNSYITSEATFDTICTGNSLAQAEVIRHIGYPERESKIVSSDRLGVRWRACYELTGCEPWNYNNMSPIGPVFTNAENNPTSSQVNLLFVIHKDAPQLRMVLGANSSLSQISVPLPEFGYGTFSSSQFHLFGKDIHGSIITKSTCTQALAKVKKELPTSGNNTRVYEAEAVMNFLYSKQL